MASGTVSPVPGPLSPGGARGVRGCPLRAPGSERREALVGRRRSSHTDPVGRPAVRQDRAFVGRQAELQVLADLVDGGHGCVGYLHGIAGIGKSVLLHRSLRLARDAGAGVVALDCRTVEPTERGVLQATGGFPDVVELGTHLASLPSPTVLALDHCESLQLTDGWLREELAAALP